MNGKNVEHEEILNMDELNASMSGHTTLKKPV